MPTISSGQFGNSKPVPMPTKMPSLGRNPSTSINKPPVTMPQKPFKPSMGTNKPVPMKTPKTIFGR